VKFEMLGLPVLVNRITLYSLTFMFPAFTVR